MMRCRACAVMVAVAAHVASEPGQETASRIEIKAASVTPDLSLSFEVASIKPSASRTSSSTVSLQPGQFRASHRTLNQLIAFAFDVRQLQIVGSPDWADSQHWEIDARTPPGYRYLEEHQAMLRRLLETRFSLKHHSEIRNRPIYELRRVRQDGTLGPHLTPFEGRCKDFRVGREGKLESADAQGIQCRFGVSRNRADAVGSDWADLNLSGELGELDRLVVDKTGLTGRFNMRLRWSSEPRDTTPDDVSIFTALREQLGLKLDPATGPVQMIVVEDVRLPGPD